MSLKTIITPWVTSRIFSEDALLKKRAKAERARVRERRPHRVEYFHQVDDPYSALMSQVLGEFSRRYHVELVCHLVPPPEQSAAPELGKLNVYSMFDANLLARRYGFGQNCFTKRPNPEHFAKASRILGLALNCRKFPDTAAIISYDLWCEDPKVEHLDHGPECSESDLLKHLAQGQKRRAELGHYLGATLYYEGEWYWGPDRLHYLEERLNELGAAHRSTAPLFELLGDGRQGIRPSTSVEMDFFFSIRSPYSAIVTPRVFELANNTRAKINFKFVLPMVMRGLPVPKAKKQYIVHDTAREARFHKVPFGRMNDPVGRPTERVLAIMPLAIEKGLPQQWLGTAMRGIWSEGADAGSDQGLRQLVENAGLNWADAQQALNDDHWRRQAERHREELFDLGLWGVPSFKVGKQAFWGQDRLWAVRKALEDAGK